MNYRILDPEEYDRLGFIFKPQGLPIPDPSAERVVAAEDNGEIVGIGILRFLPLIDGIWIKKEYRGGKVDYRKAGEILEQPLSERPGSRCYALSVGPMRKFTHHILSSVGFKPVDGMLLEKRY